MTVLPTSKPPIFVPIRLDQLAIVQVGAALLALAALLFVPSVLNDGDTYWHLAAGQWMLDHGQVLQRDVFSFTHAGKPWDTHEWLSEIAMALAFRAGGWSGLLVLYAAAVAGAAAMLAGRVGRSLGAPVTLVILAFAFFSAAPSLLARPHMLALPIVIGWTIELLAARDGDRAPRWWLALVMVLWANVHGGYLIGFALLAAFGLEALMEGQGRYLKVVRDWGLVAVLCVVATLMTPHGLGGLTYPVKIMTMRTLNSITEWRAADFSQLTPFELSLLAALFICLSYGVRTGPVRALVLLGLLHMALQHQRQQILFAMIAPLVLAQPLAAALGQQGAPAVRRPVAWAIFGGLAAAFVALRLFNPVVRTDGPTTPLSALAHVPPSLAAQPMLNTYSFGGYLIFKGVKPFIDGRSDMYGDDHVRRELRIMTGDPKSLEQAVDQYHIAWTLLAPQEPLVRVLDAKPGWRRIYGDRFAVVHVREDGKP